jgi:multiple sugar transport system permease protein
MGAKSAKSASKGSEADKVDKMDKLNKWNKGGKTPLPRRIYASRACYFMLLPFFLLFLFMTVIPIGATVGLSFTDFNMLQAPRFIGWSNYITIFLEDDVFLIAVRNTLIFAAFTGPVSYFCCLFFAWLINELPKKFRTLMTFVFYAPSISGNLFFMWLFIFSGDAMGMANSFLMRVGVISDPIQWLTDTEYNFVVVMLVQIWLSLGASFLSFIAGLRGINAELYEAGAMDGVRNRWQELFAITLPSMGPQLMFGAVMQISASFSAGAVAQALTGLPSTDYSTHTIVSHIQDFGNIRFEMGYASAISVVLFLAIVLANAVIRRVISRFASED